MTFFMEIWLALPTPWGTMGWTTSRYNWSWPVGSYGSSHSLLCPVVMPTPCHTQGKIFLVPESSHKMHLDYHSILNTSLRRCYWMAFISLVRARPRQFLACMHHACSVMSCCLPACSCDLVLDQRSGPSHVCNVPCHLGWGCSSHGVWPPETQGDCHLFILNGMLLIVMTYIKTQHLQGHGRLIVCTPSCSISCLVLFILTVLYLVTFKLAFFCHGIG